MATTSSSCRLATVCFYAQCEHTVNCTPSHMTVVTHAPALQRKPFPSYWFMECFVFFPCWLLNLFVCMCVSFCVNGKLLMFWCGICDLLLCGTI